MKNIILLFATFLLATAILRCGGQSGSADISQQSGAGSPGQSGQPGTVPSASPTSTPTASASPTMNQVTVSIPSGSTGLGTAAYGTNPLVIPQGTTVTWINNDSVPHTATSDTGIWDSGTLQTGGSFSFTFNDSGTFPYFCSIHGQASMSGTIEVTSSTQPGASPSPGMSPSPGATPSVGITPIAVR